MFGAESMWQDISLAHAYSKTRTLKISDSPSDTWLGLLARHDAKKKTRKRK